MISTKTDEMNEKTILESKRKKRETILIAVDFNRNSKHANGMCWMDE